MREDYSELSGYEPDADLALGCGLPTQFAKMSKGDTVIDLGSGAGNDCFVARHEVGETGKVIGFCGIKYLPEIDLPEVGYRFLKEFWGKGIATEAAKACVEFAKNDLKVDKLVALIIPENIGSIKVAEKLGMTKGPLIHIYDVDAYQFEMWLQK